jgi:hypothetical protein
MTAFTKLHSENRRRFAGQWAGVLHWLQLKNKPATLALLGGRPSSRVQEFLVSIARRDSRALPYAPDCGQRFELARAGVVT